MELSSEKDHSNEEWFDPHPDEDMESESEQGRQKTPKDEELKVATQAGPPERQRTGQRHEAGTKIRNFYKT